MLWAVSRLEISSNLTISYPPNVGDMPIFAAEVDTLPAQLFLEKGLPSLGCCYTDLMDRFIPALIISLAFMLLGAIAEPGPIGYDDVIAAVLVGFIIAIAIFLPHSGYLRLLQWHKAKKGRQQSQQSP